MLTVIPWISTSTYTYHIMLVRTLLRLCFFFCLSTDPDERVGKKANLFEKIFTISGSLLAHSTHTHTRARYNLYKYVECAGAGCERGRTQDAECIQRIGRTCAIRHATLVVSFAFKMVFASFSFRLLLLYAVCFSPMLRKYVHIYNIHSVCVLCKIVSLRNK